MTVRSRQDQASPCLACAWRAECQKRWNYESSALTCPDFCQDVTLGRKKKETKEDDNK